MNTTKRVDTFMIIVFITVITMTLFFPEIVQAQVNLQSSAENLGENFLSIGLACSVVSFVIGGALMNFGSPRGTMWVTSTAIGTLVMLSASGIVHLLKSSVN